MSMFNYVRDLHCDCYTFKDKEGDFGEIDVWDDGEICIHTGEGGGLLLSREQAKELATKLMELAK